MWPIIRTIRVFPCSKRILFSTLWITRLEHWFIRAMPDHHQRYCRGCKCTVDEGEFQQQGKQYKQCSRCRARVHHRRRNGKTVVCQCGREVLATSMRDHRRTLYHEQQMAILNKQQMPRNAPATKSPQEAPRKMTPALGHPKPVATGQAKPAATNQAKPSAKTVAVGHGAAAPPSAMQAQSKETPAQMLKPLALKAPAGSGQPLLLEKLQRLQSKS